jgi:vitamin B12 transporter
MTKYSQIFLLCCASLAMAHAQSSTSITGTVKDPQGRPVAGALLTLVSRSGSASNTTTSDASGNYRMERLNEGDYLLRATARGFATLLIEDVRVSTTTSTVRDIALQLAGVHEQVVVTASGTPQTSEQVSKTTTVVDQFEADARDATAVSDVVALAPGVRVQQLGGTGSFTTIQIRGSRDQGTGMLIDGLRIRDASAAQGDATGLIEDLLFTNADRIEVMNGAGSSLYGTNAIGGVINVITNEGGGHTRGNILLEGGSLGTMRERAQLAGGALSERIQYSAGVAESYVTSGVGGDSPFRDTSAQGRITFHVTPSTRLTARLLAADSFGRVLGSPVAIGAIGSSGIVNAIPLSLTLASLYASGTPLAKLSIGDATFIPGPNNPDATRAGRFVDAALTLNGQLAPALDYALNYQLVSNGRRYNDGPAGVDYQPSGSTRSLYDGRIQTAGGQLHYRIARNNLLTTGYEFEKEAFAYDTSDSSDPSASSSVYVTQQSHTAFAQDQLRLLSDRLQLSAGFRAQVFELETPSFAPLASAPFQLSTFPSLTPAYTGDASAAYFFRNSGTKLRAHAGRGYRAPSLYERFGAGYSSYYGYSVYGDPRLKPERSLSFDGGVEQSLFAGRVKASATYFYTLFQNAVIFSSSIDSATDPFGRFYGYANSRGGISRGIETSASVAPTRSLKVTGSYTYTNAQERTPIVGNVLQSFVIPQNQFSLQVVDQPTSRLSLIMDMIDSSSYLTPIYGVTGTKAYRFDGLHKINAGISYRIPLQEFHAARFFVRANNIFDQTYFENGFATAGRTIVGGLQYEF